MTFQLERFAWSPGALELDGRWDVPRRFRHVRLMVDGRRIAPISQTRSPNGSWSATFPWNGDGAPDAPLLEVGHDLLVELPAPDRDLAVAGAEVERQREALATERAEIEAARKEIAAERAALEAERQALSAEREQRHMAIQHAIELPRQPDDHVRGKAPLAVRMIAVALCSGVLVMLGMLLSAIL